MHLFPGVHSRAFKSTPSIALGVELCSVALITYIANLTATRVQFTRKQQRLQKRHKCYFRGSEAEGDGDPYPLSLHSEGFNEGFNPRVSEMSRRGSDYRRSTKNKVSFYTNNDNVELKSYHSSAALNDSDNLVVTVYTNISEMTPNSAARIRVCVSCRTPLKAPFAASKIRPE